MAFERKLLDALSERILIYANSFGANLQRQNLTAEDYGGEATFGCNDYLTLVKPAAVEKVHRSFLEVGVSVTLTCTFRSNRITLKEYGLQDRVFEINRAAAQLARRLADEYSTAANPRFVAGSMGPSGMLISSDDPALSAITFDDLADVFREQAIGLIEGGADVILIETSQDLLETKAAIFGAQRAFAETGCRLPLQAQVTLDTAGRMLLGTEISAMCATLNRLPADIIGLNCSTGPDYMREPVRYLCEHTDKFVSCIPNAGLPLNIDGRAVYTLEPEAFARDLGEYVEDFGVNVVGGCCGTLPAHLQALVERVGERKPKSRPVRPAAEVTSAMRAVAMQQVPPPFLIGERLNAQGSRKVKELLLAEDFDALTQIGCDQADGGAHALDISTALTERADEADLMRRLVHKLALSVDLPLVIDSTEPAVLETALKAAPGRCIINSVNLENGRARMDAVAPLAKAHGAALIALTIDEQGMARSAERKLAVARRIRDLAIGEFGLRDEDLIFDVLTFTLATGEAEFVRSGIETLEGIRQVKQQLPGVLTSLGVSNVSFGLPPAARAVVNSVFLYHCVQAGLDMAIVNPRQITAYADIPAEQRALAEDLIFARVSDALAKLIAAFEGVKATEQTTVDPTAGMPLAERVHYRILHRRREKIEEDIEALMAEKLAAAKVPANAPIPNADSSREAVLILNQVLLPAMKEVGDKFGSGELILPFVLQSAEVMKRAVERVERYMDRAEGTTKGKVILATVYGDVHDIGKNLVKTILANNGFTVIDLGKQVPVSTIIETAEAEKADAIGLSALLVSTSKQMPLAIQELHRRGFHVPVLIGGAAINRAFGRRTLFVEGATPYAGGVFYSKDAFEGLQTLEALRDPSKRAALLAANLQEAEKEAGRVHPVASADEAPTISASNVRRVPVPKPPAYGPRVVKSMPLDLVFACLDRDELFRLSWGAKNSHGAEWDKLKREFTERLEHMQREAKANGWLAPRGVYGYWPAQSEGDELVVFDPIEPAHPKELLRFRFPRQAGQENLCLADYFSPVGSGAMDTSIFQVVTVGSEATAKFAAAQEANEYSEGYFLHGLAVQTAEAAAEYLHRHIRRELGIEAGRGKRYSWGYPILPDLADQAKVFQLLPAERELGMSLTPAFQLVPEQSTAAIVVHHPDARYFVLRPTTSQG
jgi:5-methyltetrahydrofolate--homocysteine methyltransferase